MPHITFTQDVTLEDQPEGSGPHYRRGYSPEVSDSEAAKWIKRGVAEMGVVELKSLEEAEGETRESEERALEIPTFKRRRSKRFE